MAPFVVRGHDRSDDQVDGSRKVGRAEQDGLGRGERRTKKDHVGSRVDSGDRRLRKLVASLADRSCRKAIGEDQPGETQFVSQ